MLIMKHYTSDHQWSTYTTYVHCSELSAFLCMKRDISSKNEKYCHYSGEKSNGETSFAKPILSKYYKQAIENQKNIK